MIQGHIPFRALIDHAIAQRQSASCIDRRNLWAVKMEFVGPQTGKTYPTSWEGYAHSSTHATAQALGWARDKLAEISDEPKVRVLEVLQVGT